MGTLYNTLHYWLVDHPIISEYEWKPGHTPASSPLFLGTTIVTYLTLTLTLHHFSHLPTLPSLVLSVVTTLHNIFLCLLSLVMALGCTLSTLHQTPRHHLHWAICFPAGSTPPRGPTFFWGYIFYLSKIFEFMDTLLILLSGSRSRRLSFLHVYHHTVVVVTCYMWLSAVQTMFPVGLVTNASVHVVMYAYYLLSGMGLRPRWKRRVTDCQIAQFIFGLIVSVFMLYYHFTGSEGCSGLRVWAFTTLFGISLLVLFIDFHDKNYAKKRKSA
ncbi:hypothetical protein BUALT_Bualt10G0006900 [Buddleja alternifolia]|uniref:very-long-chain 3-oxoacyl-CoA synthase n=1 Tax=Buddleja alternifolia TaxID=168488 RepID=A0AAV6WW11_9LAMI|nr:hypothetical protein BUALT_Bualt10G0006900 [Buddleja alternifolia]